MAKRVLEITAKDDKMKLAIRAEISVPNGTLSPFEMIRLKSRLADMISTGLRDLPYSDFNSLNVSAR